jgi:hypothetical protein
MRLLLKNLERNKENWDNSVGRNQNTRWNKKAGAAGKKKGT